MVYWFTKLHNLRLLYGSVMFLYHLCLGRSLGRYTYVWSCIDSCQPCLKASSGPGRSHGRSYTQPHSNAWKWKTRKEHMFRYSERCLPRVFYIIHFHVMCSSEYMIPHHLASQAPHNRSASEVPMTGFILPPLAWCPDTHGHRTEDRVWCSVVLPQDLGKQCPNP